jgi:pimeloyl-ACP methyl ester carboxylesterase
MTELAGDYVTGIRARFEAPVDALGVSTGGSVALQLAADHPDVVRRLVLVSAACRLGPRGRAQQRALAQALAAGRHRQSGAAMLATLGTRISDPVWNTVGWLLGPLMFRHDPADLLATLAAEDAFDLTRSLPELQTPVLVIGGDRDQPYGPALFAPTADHIPHGRLILYRRTSHIAVPTCRRFVRDVLTCLNSDTNARAQASKP